MGFLRVNSEVKGVIKTSLPLVVVELVSSLYSLTDTYFVSRLGEEAVAAVGISMYLFMLIQTMASLFTVPAIVFTSQSLGSGRRGLARKSTGEVLACGLVASIAYSALSAWMTPILISIQSAATGKTYSYAVEYLVIRVGGFPILLLSMFLDSMIIGSGSTMYSMYSNGFGLILNAVLDPLFIYGYLGLPRMEVSGAAIATVVSNASSIPLQLLFLSKLGLTPIINFKNNYLKQAIELGLPTLTERLVFSIGNNIYSGVIARLGDTVMAAHNVGLRIESLIYMPGFAFSMTASTLVGRKIGAGLLGEAKKTGWVVMTTGSTLIGLIGIVVALTGYYIVAPFAPSEAVRSLSSIYLIYAGLSEFGLGFAMITSGALRGAGNTKIPMIANTASLIAVRVSLSILLANSMGPHGPWLAMFLDVYVRGFTLLIIYNFLFEKIARRIL